MFSTATATWRSLMPLGVRRMLNKPLYMLMRRAMMKNLPTPIEAIKPGPLIVSGFLKEGFGIGRAGQMTVQGLRLAGFDPYEHDLRNLLNQGAFGAFDLNAEQSGGVWILHCNPPEAIAAFSRIRREQWENRYRIGYWAYELPKAPLEWRKTAHLFHEIWVPSQFVADSLKGLDVAVRVVPHLVPEAVSGDARCMRDRYDIPHDAVVVGAMADIRSSLFRKNPQGALDIFEAAFPTSETHRNVWFVLKLSGPKEICEFSQQLMQRVKANPRIKLIWEDLSDREIDDLTASWDIFLSPHRSEGFGLAIAENFIHKKPVLATAWSGNMQFMHGLEELLIPFSETPIQDDTGVYKTRTGCNWAEPDVSKAAQMLRKLVSHPDLAEDLGRQGRDRVIASNRAWRPDALRQFDFAQFIM